MDKITAGHPESRSLDAVTENLERVEALFPDALSAPVTLEEDDIELPDLLTELQDRTQLTRRRIHGILVRSGRLHDFG